MSYSGSGKNSARDKDTTPQGVKNKEDPDAKDGDDYFLKNVPADSIAVHYGRYASYMAHAARLLRCHEKIELSGLGTAIRTVIEICEALKRQKLGTVSKIVTERYRPSEEQEQNQKKGYQNRNRSSVPKMTVTLTRGKWGLLLSGYQQKRIVSIFEKEDERMTGRVTTKQIKALNLAKVFYVDPHRPNRAKTSDEFLAKKGADLNLPEFIEYCSILVSPLLMRKAFDNACDSIVGSYQEDITAGQETSAE